jgi:hypothetical protein
MPLNDALDWPLVSPDNLRGDFRDEHCIASTSRLNGSKAYIRRSVATKASSLLGGCTLTLPHRDDGVRRCCSRHVRAVHGDPLEHHSDRPNQTDRDYDGDSDACAHLPSPLRHAEFAAFPGNGSTRYSCRRVSVHAEKRRTPSLGEPSTHPRGRGFVFRAQGC